MELIDILICGLPNHTGHLAAMVIFFVHAWHPFRHMSLSVQDAQRQVLPCPCMHLLVFNYLTFAASLAALAAARPARVVGAGGSGWNESVGPWFGVGSDGGV